MNAYEIATQFEAKRVVDPDGNVVYANVWTPQGKTWSRIYFATSKKKGEGKDYGYVFVGSDMDFSSLRSGCDDIQQALEEIAGSTPGEGDDDCPF